MSKSILLVEDDIDVRESVQLALELEGYLVASVRHGKDALDLLAQGATPDLILLDAVMPTMDGSTFLGRIKEPGSPYRKIPVVVLSASMRTGNFDGAASALAKPIDLQDLLDEIEKVLELSSRP